MARGLLSSRVVTVGDLGDGWNAGAQLSRLPAGGLGRRCASALRGQFTVQCVEGRMPWDEELRQMEEQYQPIDLDSAERRALPRGLDRAEANRRRRPRVLC